jgi:hypothetical protein
MAVSDALNNMRSQDYGAKPDAGETPEESSGVRVIQLTEEEQKELQGYSGKPGEEITCEVSGKLEQDGHFHVMSVRGTGGGGLDEDAKAVAEGSLGGAPLMQSQTMPSPS